MCTVMCPRHWWRLIHNRDILFFSPFNHLRFSNLIKWVIHKQQEYVSVLIVLLISSSFVWNNLYSFVNLHNCSTVNWLVNTHTTKNIINMNFTIMWQHDSLFKDQNIIFLFTMENNSYVMSNNQKRECFWYEIDCYQLQIKLVMYIS